VLVSIGASYDAARAGRTHQSPEDIELLDSLPGITSHVPGHPDEVPAMVARAVAEPHTSYIRLSTEANREPVVVSDALTPIRHGSRALVIAIGPMLDPVLDATRDLDVTVAYATTVRPLDASGIRSLAVGDAIVIVEPYLAGTSIRQVVDAAGDRPYRTLGLGVTRTELRRYGTPADHDQLYGLDAAGIRASVDRFLSGQPASAPMAEAR
jgi:transketolase